MGGFLCFYKMGVIYKITSPSGKLYVGKTYDLRKRVNAYKCDVKKNRKDLKLHNSLRKYGWDAHILAIIEEVSDELMNEREIYWISELNTYCYNNPMGLNMTKGGDGQRNSWINDLKRREKQSKLFSGEGNPFFGKTHSNEYKLKKSKQTSEYNKKNSVKIPEWGVEKGRELVRRKVVCYDSSGKFVKEFKSISEASLKLNIDRTCINLVVMGRRSHAGGYVFRYWEENFAREVEVGDLKKQGVKRPVIVVGNGKWREFPSAQEASEELGIPKTTINRAAMYNGGRPIRAGYTFYYKDSFEGIPQQQNRPDIQGAIVLKW